jgi:hypothetical protein
LYFVRGDLPVDRGLNKKGQAELLYLAFKN